MGYLIEDKQSLECYEIHYINNNSIDIRFVWAYSEEEAQELISNEGFELLN